MCRLLGAAMPEPRKDTSPSRYFSYCALSLLDLASYLAKIPDCGERTPSTRRGSPKLRTGRISPWPESENRNQSLSWVI